MVIIKLYRGNYFKLKMTAVNSENKKTFESVNENQESNEILPAIVDGKFFKIVARSKKSNKISAICLLCVRNIKPLSGTLASTSNFVKHLKVIFSLVLVKFILSFLNNM